MNNLTVILFTYNRPRHTLKTIENLKDCIGSDLVDLIIYSDFFKSKEDAPLVKETRAILKTISGFNSVNIQYRNENFGLAKSIVDGVSTTLKLKEHVIVLEDDMIVGKYFLKYMSVALDKYKNESQVLSISGYAYNIKTHPENSAYFLPTSSNQAWATWSDRWFEIDFNLTSIKTSFLNRFRFNEMGAIKYYERLIEVIENESNHSWAILFKWHLFTKKKLTLFPSENLVENIGWDGSGTNCVEGNPYQESVQKIDSEIFKFPEQIKSKKINYLKLLVFFQKIRFKGFLNRNK